MLNEGADDIAGSLQPHDGPADAANGPDSLANLRELAVFAAVVAAARAKPVETSGG